MQNKNELLYPSKEAEALKHKKKRLIPSPNSYFLDVLCGSCETVTTTFSHATAIVTCKKCSGLLGTPTGGKLDIVEGSKCKRKN
ncbi:MAG: 40S ribosomal protein S27 [Amphiamblys sp. WSBS2006]|nr:MAG: 40S ribosomal protein S27 [Amphiamblys sp. WSBS2006]